MKFDLFVYFHSPESLDLYGVKSGILPSETKGKTENETNMKSRKLIPMHVKAIVSTVSNGKAI